MNKHLLISLAVVCALLSGFVLSQVTYAGANINPEGLGTDTAQGKSHNGRKAKIIVDKINDKTGGKGKFQEQFGPALSEMLTTALVETNRFIVLDQETIGAIRAAGGQPPRPDLMVVGAVTAFAPDASGVDLPGAQWGKTQIASGFCQDDQGSHGLATC